MVDLLHLLLLESLSFSLNNSEKELFYNSSTKELSNVVMELAARTLLICKRLGDETAKGAPPAEGERLKKELVDSAQTLETTLNANTSLSEKMK